MVFTILGFVFMGIGIIGIFLPILPTTPFLILAALLFAKGNSRFATVLLKNKYLAAYINNYRNKVGVPIKTKITSLVFLWGLLIISMIAWVKPPITYLLVVVGIAVTIHLLCLKTKK
ncbi:MAG: YbaN family protein [Bacillota bacterium]|jgi:uncharacterized membrane protein YbaN (DUF454 family)